MQVNIRIEDTLYKKLRESAKNNRRTITAELDLILSNALETNEKDITTNSIKSNRTMINTPDNHITNSIEEGGFSNRW